MDKELKKFEKLFIAKTKSILPEIKKFEDKELEKIIPFSHTMYTFPNVRPLMFINSLGHKYTPKRAYIFIHTDINPNGIASTGRIGRTWAIDFEVKGNYKPYRCRRIEEDAQIFKFYSYNESPEEVIKSFIAWYNTAMTNDYNFKRFMTGEKILDKKGKRC